MPPVIWRNATIDDADALSHLGAATFLNTFAYDHPGKPLIEHLNAQHSSAFYRSKLSATDVDIIIGETPLGAPVGYALLVPPEHPDLQQPGDLELKRIYLLSGWQGGGNGSALLQRVFDQAAIRGAKRLLLAVYESNHRAVEFYQRAGFKPVGVTRFMVGDVPFRDMVYVRDIG